MVWKIICWRKMRSISLHGVKSHYRYQCIFSWIAPSVIYWVWIVGLDSLQIWAASRKKVPAVLSRWHEVNIPAWSKISLETSLHFQLFCTKCDLLGVNSRPGYTAEWYGQRHAKRSHWVPVIPKEGWTYVTMTQVIKVWSGQARRQTKSA